jgi:nicotinic acid mononucleotide adenylyltransferase
MRTETCSTVWYDIKVLCWTVHFVCLQREKDETYTVKRKYRKYKYNVTLRNVRGTIVSVENQWVLFILIVCL